MKNRLDSVHFFSISHDNEARTFQPEETFCKSSSHTSETLKRKMFSTILISDRRLLNTNKKYKMQKIVLSVKSFYHQAFTKQFRRIHRQRFDTLLSFL